MSDNIENIDENEVAPEVQKVDQSKLMKEKNVDAVSKKQVAMKVLVQIGLYAFLTIMALIVLFPFYWMLMSSVKTINEYNAVVPTLWPHQFRWETYKVAFERVDFGRVFLNTCFVMCAAQWTDSRCYFDHIAHNDNIPVWEEASFDTLAQARERADFAPYLPQTAPVNCFGSPKC